MSNVKVGPSDKQIEGHIVLKISDTESPFCGIEYYYEGMKFADKENEDGSIQMTFEYTITDGEIPEGKQMEFEAFLGDQLITILEDQMAREEVVFKGGTGETELL
jgi:hypothetical protein